MDRLKAEFKNSLLDFDTDKAKNLLSEHISEKKEEIPILIEEVLSEIGNEWQNGELALSQVYMSGKICEEIVEELFPCNNNNEFSEHKIAIVTFNDFHSLGKKIVMSVLRSVGFSIKDIGQGLNVQNLADTIIKEKIDILLISVLMLPSALKIRELRETKIIKEANLKILVGGAPFTFDSTLWQQVGADAMGHTPSDAIQILNNWLK